MPLSESELNDFTLQFLLLDTNSDGFVATDQVKSLLRSLGFYPSEVDIERVISLVDSKKDGLISKENLLPVVEKLYAQKSQHNIEAELRVALRVLDEDMDGYITSGQLRHILLNMGTPLQRELADIILDDVEKDSYNKISVEELITMLLNSYI
ncbi:unnamed protein product [Phytomonas sp. Hart1]|nr:unnamed protein product [Phytomonas sp. Hart1]|eukprot:CCW71829.1 unnamed protein product [Phytomonas sp. isolate Hart1]